MRYLIFLILIVSLAFALDNGLGLTPPLGFNTWNHFQCNINEKVISDTIDAFINLGLREAGYVYINIDDCWMANERVDGKLVPDKKKFPNGIASLAKRCHDNKLKLGIYSSAGTKTCAKFPASLGYEDVDAQTWADWGIDYLKYDNCYGGNQTSIVRYTKMRDALNKTKRPIFYSICNWGEEKVFDWGAKVGNSWRTTGDISDNFNSVRNIYFQNIQHADKAEIGGWNDPDMLEIGNGRMSNVEYRTHFALWAMAKSPLLIGCDLTKITEKDLSILKHKEMIDLNQDKLGKQASHAPLNYTSKDYGSNAARPVITMMPLENKDYAIAITNWNDKKTFDAVNLVFKELMLPGTSYKIRDVWAMKNLGTFKDRFIVLNILSHETKVYRLTQS